CQHGKTRTIVRFTPISSTPDRNVWTLAAATLAPDSRHIVAFSLSSTTYRAADSLLKRSGECVRVGWLLALPGWVGDSTKASPHVEEETACRGLTSGSNCSKSSGPTACRRA